MKRIFIIQNTPLNEPLPLSVYLTSLLSHLKKTKDFELNLIIAESKIVPEQIKKNINNIYQIKGSTYSIKDNVKFSRQAYNILKKEDKMKRIDIIHCFYPNSSLLGAVLFKKIKNDKTRIIYDVRSPWIEMSIDRGHVKNLTSVYKFILYTQERRLCRNVDGFIFITNGLKNHYIKSFHIKSNKILVSPSGVNLKLFKKVKTDIRKRYGIKDNEILIGHIGTTDKSRRLDQFLDIFKKTPKSFKLMFVGYNKDLLDLLEKYDFKDRVILVDKVPQKEIPEYICAFDFGLCHLPDVFLYRYSVPLKILEYLACEIPILASNMEAHINLEKNLDGIYIYRSEKDLLNIMKKAKINPKLKEYSWESISNKYENFWRNLG